MLKERLSELKSDNAIIGILGRSGKYEALSYEADMCVVRGPIAKPRKTNDEKTFRLNVIQILLPDHGVAVVCQGLQNAQYLNGKVGDIRSFDDDSGRYEVYFDEKSIPAKRVKHENLRILFELPE